MRVYKTRWFHRWAAKKGIDDARLRTAVEEICRGLVDAGLGRGLCKKRVALPGKGKRGGARTLLAFRHGQRAVFVYGFAKSARGNISGAELMALRRLAVELLGYGSAQIDAALEATELIEIDIDER